MDSNIIKRLPRDVKSHILGYTKFGRPEKITTLTHLTRETHIVHNAMQVKYSFVPTNPENVRVFSPSFNRLYQILHDNWQYEHFDDPEPLMLWPREIMQLQFNVRGTVFDVPLNNLHIDRVGPRWPGYTPALVLTPQIPFNTDFISDEEANVELSLIHSLHAPDWGGYVINSNQRKKKTSKKIKSKKKKRSKRKAPKRISRY